MHQLWICAYLSLVGWVSMVLCFECILEDRVAAGECNVISRRNDRAHALMDPLLIDPGPIRATVLDLP